MEFGYDIQPDEIIAFNEYLAKKDFSKLYAWAVELAATPEHLLQITDGKWVKYDQGSNPTVLVKSIRGRGTGWYSAGFNTALKQLQDGDFYVYYTIDDDGQPTLPRLAIRMDGHSRIAEEPRGIAYKQNLDPYILPILEQKMQEFGQIGTEFRERANDMRMLTAIEKKDKDNLDLTREELVFLYEIDKKIVGFGHAPDPRIEDLRSRRNKFKDVPIVFNCSPNEVAWTEALINVTTKVYVGPLVSGLLSQFTQIERIYTSFPDREIVREEITVGRLNRDGIRRAIKLLNIYVGPFAKKMMRQKDFMPQEISVSLISKLFLGNSATTQRPEQVRVVRLKVGDLGLPDNSRTADVFRRADELGLKACPAEVGPLYCLLKRGGSIEQQVAVVMKPIQLPERSEIFNVWLTTKEWKTNLLDSLELHSDDVWMPDMELLFSY